MLTTLVNLLTLLFAVFALGTLLVLPIVMLVARVRRPGLWQSVKAFFHPPHPVMAVATVSGSKPFTLPPLPSRRILGGWERRLDGMLFRAATTPVSWWWTGGRWLVYLAAIYALFLAPLVGDQASIQVWTIMLIGFTTLIALLKPQFRYTLAALTLRFGRTFPYVLRPWYWLSIYARERLKTVKTETARTVYLRRLFSLTWTDGTFRSTHAIGNWLTFLLVLFYLPMFLSNGIEAGYAWGSYPFGTYTDIDIAGVPYRNITNQNTYSVHGFKIIDGVKHEYYFELGPNIWFWQLYPEYMFGQIPAFGRCTFHTYGITFRVPARLRLFSAGSLYALNPWIVGMECTSPSIVPSK
jgi:hypothetical protein